MNPRIKSVTPEDNYCLLLEFNNGEWRRYDVSPLLERGVFKPLKNYRAFRQVRPWMGTIAWAGGQDLCPDTLYLDSVPISQ